MRTLTFALSLTIIISLGFLLSTCKNPKNQKLTGSHSGNILVNKDLLIIDLDTLTRSKASYSDVFSSIKYIPLQTTNECLIGHINHIELFNDTLYILDGQAKSILIYDLSGTFVRKLGTIGKGPGEWISPYNFTIDKSKKLLFVLDAQLQRITILTLQGKLIKQIQLKGNTRSHCIESDQGRIYLDARHYATTGGEEDYMIREINNSGDEVRNWFSFNKDNKGWTQSYYLLGSGTFYSAPADIKYADLFMDTIYSVSTGSIKPFIAIKSSKIIRKEVVSDIQKLSANGGNYMGELIKSDGLWGINNYIENDDIIYFLINGGGSYNLILIDKKSHQIRYLKGFKNDFTFKELANRVVMPNFYSGEKNMIIGGYNNVEAFQTSLKLNSTNLSDKEKNKLLSIPELNNPILILAITKGTETK